MVLHGGRDRMKHGFRILVLVQVLALCLLLPGCFREEETVLRFREDEAQWQEDLCASGEVELEPGVYQVRVRTRPEMEGTLYVEVVGEESLRRILQGNGVVAFPGEEYTDFEVYATDRVSSVHIQCTRSGQASWEDLSLVRLNWGNRMALVVGVFAFGLLDTALWWRKRILQGKISSRQQAAFWVLLACVLAAYFPYLTDYFSLGVDTSYHLLRIEGLRDTLAAGGPFPTRIHSYYNFAHGTLIPALYSDLFLYLPALLRLTGFSIMTAYKVFVFGVVAAVGVLSYKSIKRCAGDTWAAVAGSAVCLFSPYFLSNLYRRGAVGEALALAFVPPVCCGMYLLFTEENSPSYKRHKWWIVGGISGLLYSHILSLETVVFFMLVCCMVFWRRTFRRRTFVQLLQAVGIVLLVNCWFWFPMLYLMGSDSFQLWEEYSAGIQGRGELLMNMVRQLVPESRGEGAFFGVGMTAALLLYPLAGGLRGLGRKAGEHSAASRGSRIFWWFTVGAVVVSTGYFPWDVFRGIPLVGSFVESLQFPTHFMVPGAGLGGMFAAFLYLWLRERAALQGRDDLSLPGTGGMGKRAGEQEGPGLTPGPGAGRIYLAAAGALAFLTVGSGVYQVNSIAFDYAPVYLYTAENMGTLHQASGFFLPVGCEVEEMHYHRPVPEEGLKYDEYTRSGTTMAMRLENSTEATRYLEVPVTGYYGYQVTAEDGGGDKPYIVPHRGAHGDLRIAVPAFYTGSILVSYKGDPLFRAAEWISLLSLGVILDLRLLGRERKRKCLHRKSGN